MANVLDYLKWWGNIRLCQAGFNDVDGLILSRLSYIPFDGIVTENLRSTVTISEAADEFFRLEAIVVAHAEDTELLSALSLNERFKDMRLSGYINALDFKTQKQFAAIVIDTGDIAYYVSYRGTDDTLIGWKENFNMNFMTPVPSQEDAVRYLEMAANALPGGIRIGGHSKGGNLAAYAASFCSKAVQKRIICVYNNDGPGFDSAVISQEGYSAVRGKIHTFVPQSSVIGMLFEHDEEYKIIRSTQTGLLQHDLYSWEVILDHFIYLDTVSNGSKFIDRTVKEWTAALKPEQRGQFIDALYDIFNQTGAKTLTELTEHWYKHAQIVLKSLKNMDGPTRQLTSQVLSLLLKSARRNLSIFKPKIPSLPTRKADPE